MKILFVNRMAALVRGGGETFDLQIAEALQRLGHEVEFLSGRRLGKSENEKCKIKKGGAGGTLKAEDGERRTEDGGLRDEGRRQAVEDGGRKELVGPQAADHRPQTFKWHTIRSPYLGWFPWDKVRGGWRIRNLEFRIFEWLAVRWILRHGNDYDVVQICELPYVVSELRRLGYKRPLVMRLPGPNYDHYGDAVKKADGIIASGTTIATVMREQRPDAVNVPNCVDSERFRHQASNIRGQTPDGRSQNSAFRFQYGIGADELVLLYVARLQGFKDHDTLIRAFALVHAQIHESRLVLAGSGHIERDVRALIGELGLDGFVIMLGETNYDELPKVYAATDIKVISSIYESFCFAALEGMAMELPIVTTDNGWVPQLLGRGEVSGETLLPGYQEPDDKIHEYAGGLVVPKKNPEKLAEAILQLAGDREKRRRIGERNRREVVKKYNWEKSAEILEQLYEQLTTDRHS